MFLNKKLVPSASSELKNSPLGSTAEIFFPLQEEDCRRNCVSGIGMEEDPMAVSKLYEAKGMQYIWMPTFETW